MSGAEDAFQHSIKDAEELLAHYDRASEEKTPRPAETEVLKRAGLILAVTAWETYVEDRVREALNQKLGKISESGISDILHKKLEKDLKKFHNPDTQKTRELFSDYIGFDPTSTWKCWATNAATKKQLDRWVKKRGAAAHRSKEASTTPKAHLVSRPELAKVINFFKKLVEETEKALRP